MISGVRHVSLFLQFSVLFIYIYNTIWFTQLNFSSYPIEYLDTYIEY
jgi:hypothetical protein